MQQPVYAPALSPAADATSCPSLSGLPQVGWGATARFTDKWAWDQAAETYALDPAMAEKLRKANPQVWPWALALTNASSPTAAGHGDWMLGGIWARFSPQPPAPSTTHSY